MKSNYWVNSNSGDYIEENGGKYYLHLISRGDWQNYQRHEIIEITQAQFSTLKGFVPIKEKKLFGRTSGLSQRGKYAPTLSDGTKGKSERIEVPSVAEAREKILKDLGL